MKKLGLLDFIHKIIFTTDRGANIQNALKKLNINRLNCFDHLLNNTVEKVCKLDIVDHVLNPVRSLVKYIKIGGHNTKFTKSLKSYVKTRWNTNFDMGNSVDESFDQIEVVLAQLREEHRISAINRLYLKEIVNFLKIFKELLVEMEKSLSPTLYLVWPSFLHPQMKSLKFATEDEKLQTIRDLKELIQTVTIDVTPEPTRRRRSNDSVISVFFDEESDMDEVELYVAYKVNCGIEIDLLQWWQEQKETFPRLYKIAMFVQSIPATSAPSERKFSLAGNILNCLRSSLDPAKVEDLLLLHSNNVEEFSHIETDTNG